jgi:hypothetical protein
MDPVPLIATQVHTAAAGFVSLEQALRKSSQYAIQVSPEAIVDAFERFKIWAGNIAAHRKGRRSLEYRLRDAAHLKDEAHSLLVALHESLQRGEAAFRINIFVTNAHFASFGNSDRAQKALG